MGLSEQCVCVSVVLHHAPLAKLHQVGPAHAGHHNFGHKVADGCCRLLGLQLSQDMTLVLCPAGSLLGHKSKDSSGKNFSLVSLSKLFPRERILMVQLQNRMLKQKKLGIMGRILLCWEDEKS